MITGLIAVSIILTGCQKTLELTVGSEKISSEEYLKVMNSIKLDVANEISPDNNANINSDFWKTETNGELPYHVLAEKPSTRSNRYTPSMK